MNKVILAHSSNRQQGVRNSLAGLIKNPVKGKSVLIKPNFNTADRAPGSTHNDTLLALVEELWAMGAQSIAVGERSYPPTREVMLEKGILPLLSERDVPVIDFDQLPTKDWVAADSPDSHWQKGFRIARPIMEAECLVSTGCVKTHQFGGVFTMSLKLHVGVVPTFRHGFPYMGELHESPYQQEMIAEINAPFTPDLVLLDGVDVFVDGGPATGKRAAGNLMLATTDRVAADATGVALLKVLGSNPAIMEKPIFQQRQILRAVELGLGVSGASEIELIAADDQSLDWKERISEALASDIPH